jgi:hypothetical protein|tara:strand:- start:893 stop:1024 length:132 start_codon:yes stop_codon:yes gene_type:complete
MNVIEKIAEDFKVEAQLIRERPYAWVDEIESYTENMFKENNDE